MKKYNEKIASTLLELLNTNWDSVPDEVKIDKFLKLEDPYVVIIPEHVKCITDEIKNKKFLMLNDDELICNAGRNWTGLTKENKNKMFMKLKYECYVNIAGRYWGDITKENLESRFMEMRIVSNIYDAGLHWKGLSNAIKDKKFSYLLGNEYYIYLCGRDWTGVSVDNKKSMLKTFKNGKYRRLAKSDWFGNSKNKKK